MKLSYIMLRVSDMEKSVGFWRDQVGLETDWTGGEFAFFPLGETYLALNQPPSFEPQVSGTEVVLGGDDVRAGHAEMKDRGLPFEVEPRPVTNDGTRSLLSAYFRDP